MNVERTTGKLMRCLSLVGPLLAKADRTRHALSIAILSLLPLLLNAAVPVVDNDGGATNLSIGVVLLNGTLSTDTGDVVNIYWGTTDGGDTNENWANTNTLTGVPVGSFSNTVSNLLYGLTYYYRCYATNADGSAWAPTTTNFTTLPPTDAGVGVGNRMKISFTNFNRAETLTNFPVLVVLSNGMAGTAFNFNTMLTTNGYDLRFWNDVETTNLNYEIETWSTGSSSYVWVQVPQFTSNCYIWATWGDSTKTTQPVYCTNGATWESSFAAVWHLKETPTANMADSTTNRNNATSAAAISQVNGIIDGSLSFANNAACNVPSTTRLKLLGGKFTLSAWVNLVDSPDGVIIGKGQNGVAWYSWYLTVGNNPGVDEGNTANRLCVGLRNAGGGGTTRATQTADVTLGSWVHVAGTLDGSSMVLYVNGVSNNAVATAIAPYDHATQQWIGSDSGRDYLNGKLDELRVEDTARSTNWIWACYMNQASNSAFNKIEVIAQGSLQNNTATNIVNNAADLTATLNSSGAVYQVFAYWGTADGTNNAAGLWQNTNSLGWYTNMYLVLTNHVSGLASDTPYYYTFQITNSFSNFWSSPSASFTTLGPPVVTNLGPTNSNSGSATLKGSLTAGTTGNVYICWGTNDGGTTATSAWNKVEALGVRNQGEFSGVLGGLTYGVQYYYRCYVTNDYGQSWAPSASGFLSGRPYPTNPVAGNMEAWYDAGYGVSTNSSSNVTNWIDRSGNGRNAVVGAGTSLFAGMQVNGLPAVLFRGGNNYLNINSNMIPREEYIVFKSGRYALDANTNLFGNDWGGPFGQQNDNGWMFQSGTRQMWNSRVPLAVSWNGTPVAQNNADGNPYGLPNVANYMILKVNPLNYGSASSRIGRPNTSWGNGYIDVAEIIVYSNANSTASEETIGSYLGWKYGISHSYPLMTSITNLPVSTGFTSTSATFNATFRGLASVFDVYVYWGTNDGGTVAGSWGNTNLVGSYTNVNTTNLTFFTNVLAPGTEYYYRFCAQNAATNMWAEPVRSVQTLGVPVINNAGGASCIRASGATLNGELSAGGTAAVYICWGYINAGTNSGTGAWQRVESAGAAYQKNPFAAEISGALFGIPYYYTCFATNSFGSAWSVVTNFTTLRPAPMLVTSGLQGWYDASYGVTTSVNNVQSWADKSGNGKNATVVVGTPTLATNDVNGWPAVKFRGGNNYLNINSAMVPREEYIVFRSGRYEYEPWNPALWGPDWGGPFGQQNDSGWMLESGQARTWADASRVPLGMVQNGTTLPNVGNYYYMTNVNQYMILKVNPQNYASANCRLGRPNNSWGNGYFDVAEVLVYNTTLSAEDEARVGGYLAQKYGISSRYAALPVPAIENTGVTDIVADAAKLNGTLYATQSVYDVWVFWSTNNCTTNKATWLSTGSNQYMGSFTNLTSTNLVQLITGLPGSTTYYYNYYASNVVEELWGNSYVFGSDGPPTVQNSGVTNLGRASATLRGVLTTGGQADIYICWGTSNGGTSTGAWDHVDAMGARTAGNVFSNAVTAAFYGVTYYYNCYATNANGSDWADAATSFMTPMPEGYVNTLPVTNNIEAWYDAGSGVTTSGVNVTMWADRSGKGRNTTSVSGTPELSNGQINGRPGIKFRAEHMVVNHAMVPREEYIVFRSGRYDSDPNPNLWYGGWGGPFGQQNDDGWMLEDGQTRTWNSRIPIAMKQNGTNATYTGSQYYFDRVGSYMVLKVNPLNYASANVYIGRPNNSWYNGHLDIAEIIIYSATNTVADENTIGGYLAWKYGITTTYGAFIPPNDSYISNTPVSNLGTNQFTMNAAFNGSSAVYHVWAFWSTNDCGTNAATWLANGGGAYVGSFTNAITSISYLVTTGMITDTNYYYTFRGTNEVAEIWGVPSMSFKSLGPPAVDNDGGATNIGIGTATLRGGLTAGGAADVYVCWGTVDAGTNSGISAWEHVEPFGQILQLTSFSTNITGAYYGQPYYYRCYASNSIGTAWAAATTNFTTLEPVFLSGVPVTNGLVCWFDAAVGVTTNASAVIQTWNDISGNAHHGTLASDAPVIALNQLNSKPAALFRGNNDWLNLAGTFFAKEHYIVLRSPNANWSNYGGFLGRTTGRNSNYLTENANTTFHGNQYPAGVSKNGTALASAFSLAPLTSYMVVKIIVNNNDTSAASYQIGRGDSYSCDWDVTEIIGYNSSLSTQDESLVGGYLATKYGLTTTYPAYSVPVPSYITNLPPSGYVTNSALLAARLSCSGVVYNVYAYWNTNNYGTNAVAWTNSAYAGTWTNISTSTNISCIATGLLPNTTYYFTFQGSNAVTNIWATNVLSFVSPGPPAVNNASGATNIGIGYATLNGNLPAGGSANIYICWGTNDGGTTATSAWNNVESLGFLNQGAFSNTVSNLYYGLIYYYRCYATNDFGEAWATPVTNFTTLPLPIGISAGGGTTTNYTLNGTNFIAHIFTNSGTFSVTNGGNVEVLVVAGGGGGGTGNGGGWEAGGGGGGGIVYHNGKSVSNGTFYSVTVGGGGNPGVTGSDSVFDNITAKGGGAGAINPGVGSAGGSGGGGTHPQTAGGASTQTNSGGGTGYGNAGGTPSANSRGGGGGGAGGPGGTLGLGGAGRNFPGFESSSSTNGFYGGGGGAFNALTGGSGGGGNGGNPATAGVNGTGGGGGGGYGSGISGGKGGSGIVLVRYPYVLSGTAIANNFATNVVNTAADLVATLSATGAVYNVWCCWGTVDGTNNGAGLWQNTNSFGWYTNRNIVLTNSLTGLIPGMQYYYTFMATNDLTNFWASPSTQFFTAGPPFVDNDGGAVTSVVGSATLRGNLLSTGGAPVTVYTYWGTNDAGTNKLNWVNVYTNGTMSVGAFSNTVTNLYYGLRYYYRTCGSNANGEGWAAATTNFITMDPVNMGLTSTNTALRANVPEALNYDLIYEMNILAKTNYGNSAIPYDINNATNFAAAFSRVAYYLELTTIAGATNWVYISMPAFTNAPTKLGIPNQYSGEFYRYGAGGGPITNASIRSNVGGIGTGDGTNTISLEFWPSNYGQANDWGVPGASGVNYDFGDGAASNTSSGYGSMQIHNYGASQTLFAYNDWNNAGINSDLGIGNRAAADTDWTFAANAAADYSRRVLQVLVGVYPRIGMTMTSLPAVGQSTISETLNASLVFSGSVYNVYAHWNTVNGGTDAGLWTNSQYIGTWTNVIGSNISCVVAGLSTNTTYYFTFRGSNVVGQFWATNVLTFQTIGPVAVDNDGGASNISAGVTTMRGTLTNGPANVYIYWGTSDGGTNNANWGNTNFLGSTVNGAFSGTVSNLIYGITYYYRCYVSNAYDGITAWAPATTNFTTLAPVYGGGAIYNNYATNIFNAAAEMTATLNATGTAFQAWVYWGTVDGTNNAAALWQYSASLGWYTNVGLVLTNTVATLSTNTYYYYTFMVTNALTNIWSPSSVNFLTRYDAYLPFTETFDDSPTGMARTLGNLPIQHGWRADIANNAKVQNGVVYGGTKAGSLVNTRLWHHFLGAPATNVWVDFYAKPQRRISPLPPEQSTNSTTAFYVNEQGNVVALSNSTWLVLATNYVVSTSGWTRFTLNLDYAASNWSLYVAGGESNDVSTNLAMNLGFQGTATNTAFGQFRVNAVGDIRTAYIDSISMADGANTNMPLNIDSDNDRLPDLWEYRFFSDLAKDGTVDSDGDGWTDWYEYLAGTDPTDAGRYAHIGSLDIVSTASSNILVNMLAGGSSLSSVYAGDASSRRFIVMAANNNWTNRKVFAAAVADTTTGTNIWTDVNATGLYTNRYYYMTVSYGQYSYTNMTEDWSMYVQNRPVRQKFLISVPIDYGNTNVNNLNSTLGQHLARGLSAGGTTNDSDRIEYMTTNGLWSAPYYLTTNADGSVYWRDYDFGVTANVPVSAGMGFWVYRGTNSAVRTNAVFTGKSFAASNAVPFTFSTNSWTMFGWPLPKPRRHVNAGTNTLPNQLGFETIGSAGNTSNPKTNYLNRVGDQIWVWKDNTWKNNYWLVGHLGSSWDGRWWDDSRSSFANFQLEPGMAYYYKHPTNQWGGTNFVWTPTNAP